VPRVVGSLIDVVVALPAARFRAYVAPEPPTSGPLPFDPHHRGHRIQAAVAQALERKALTEDPDALGMTPFYDYLFSDPGWSRAERLIRAAALAAGGHYGPVATARIEPLYGAFVAQGSSDP
jgi:hypothetical protein